MMGTFWCSEKFANAVVGTEPRTNEIAEHHGQTFPQTPGPLKKYSSPANAGSKKRPVVLVDSRIRVHRLQ